MTAPPDPGLIRWLYHFTDFRSGRLKATLPMRDVTLAEVLGGPADGTGEIPLHAVEAQAHDAYDATVARRTCMWAERRVLDSVTRAVRSSTVPWAGLVMRRSRSLAGRSIKLTAVTWPAYLARRLTPDLDYRGGADRFTVARGLVSAAAAQPASTFPVTPPHLAPWRFPDGPLMGVTSQVLYQASDLRTVLDDLDDLATADPAFDWRMAPRMAVPGDLSSLQVTLELGYPRLGRVAPPDLRWSTLPADLPGRWGHLADATLVEDGSAADNRTTVLGEGSGPTQVRATVTADEAGIPELEQGFPLYEGQTRSGTVALRTAARAQAHAIGAIRAQLMSEVRLSGVKVRGDLAPDLTAYAVGDDVTLDLGDTLTGSPLTIVGQVVGRSITPSERGRTEGVTMDVQGTMTVAA